MYICICEQVTDKQITTAIKKGASRMRDLRKELGIASQCGQCGRCAKDLLKKHCSGDKCRQTNTRQNSTVSTEVFPLFSEQLLVTE